MLLTCIVPAYNASTTIERALRSVLTQRHELEVEIIVVDDGSRDATIEVVARLAQEYRDVSILGTTANAGPGIARNTGVEAARGQWICFLDADDEWAPGALERLAIQLTNLDETAKTDIVAFDWRYAQPPGEPSSTPLGGREDLAILSVSDKHEHIRSYLGNLVDPSVIFHCYRRAFLERDSIRFYGGYHEDVDFSFHALLCANKIEVIAKTLYLKWNEAGSIVNTLGIRHIHGYFDAIDRVEQTLQATGKFSQYRRDFTDFFVNILASRLVRLLQEHIAKTDSVTELLIQIHHRALALLQRAELKTTTPTNEQETRYYKMFHVFMQDMNEVEQTKNPVELMKKLADLQNQSWSCFDLHHALFLAPNEIRTCCKRYYHRGQMKGDVVLLHGNADAPLNFSQTDILQAKLKLHHDINRNRAPQCEGCPFLTFGHWGKPLETGIKYLSLEYHSICNMRCSYCSPTYYAGEKPTYDIAHTLHSLRESKALDHCEYIVWGGGEPTLDKQFSELALLLTQYAPKPLQRVITNATKYIPSLATMMKQDQAFIVTSLDAGTEATFRKVRKFHGLERVLEHLQRYVTASPCNTIIKYIALKENIDKPELTAFVEAMNGHELLAANFQLSCDFRSESLTLEEIQAITWLYSALLMKQARFIFLDDLIWQRFPAMTETIRNSVDQYLTDEGYPNQLATATEHPQIIIWGTGAQARLLMNKSHFLKQTHVLAFIDSRENVIGTEFLGKPVLSPATLHEHELPVLIVAVQSAPFIYRELNELGISPGRIITKLPL